MSSRVRQYAPRESYSDAGRAGRDAMERLNDSDLPRAQYKVIATLIQFVSGYSRFAEEFTLEKAANLTRTAEETCSRALNAATELGIIAWRSRQARGESWFALASEFLPDVASRRGSRRSSSNLSAVVKPVREEVNEEKTPRESVPVPVPDSSPHVARVMTHLFSGKGSLPPGVQTTVRWAIANLPPGSTAEIVALATAEHPAKSIPNPRRYAQTVIQNAKDDWLAGMRAPAVSRETSRPRRKPVMASNDAWAGVETTTDPQGWP